MFCHLIFIEIIFFEKSFIDWSIIHDELIVDSHILYYIHWLHIVIQVKLLTFIDYVN